MRSGRAAGLAAVLLAVALLLAMPEKAAAVAGPDATGGQLTVELRPAADVTVGDRVEAELVLVWRGGEPLPEPRFPTWGEHWGEAEILHTGAVESPTEDGAHVYRQTITLTAFRTGTIELPPVTVAVPLVEETRELFTPEGLAFTVASVLPATAPADLEPRPATPPVSLPATPRFAWSAGLLAMFGLLAAGWLGRRRAGETVPAPRAAPLAELLARLGELQPTAGSGPVHTRLSLALRDFLGRSLDIHARESTTTEIRHRLRSLPPAAAVADDTFHLLKDCDQVKYALQSVASEVTDTRLTQARTLARTIDEALTEELTLEEQ